MTPEIRNNGVGARRPSLDNGSAIMFPRQGAVNTSLPKWKLQTRSCDNTNINRLLPRIRKTELFKVVIPISAA
jgi:hypothetical protein